MRTQLIWLAEVLMAKMWTQTSGVPHHLLPLWLTRQHFEMLLIKAIQDVVNICKHPNQNWISKVQNPCYFIGNFVRFAANDEFAKRRTLFLPQSANNGIFYGVVRGNTQCFVKKIANLPRFLDFEPIFGKKARTQLAKTRTQSAKIEKKVRHFKRTHCMCEMSKNRPMKPATKLMSNF